ncbi:ribose ABC transporter (permease) [Petrocella atlantisensis]|uniref:Ribose ABC transporter (Permease) n=1 Tax=Petrocella atlantisensis TaxID=2173034 RepID=A0A3P7P447_9FIRM|nr:MAG: ribose ABC transporter permease [Firmicutes bacterium HGW-Firmicutes-5]VDN48340.1 ribose ABC transporter (permease) [Petrocella atlantisensis]
MNNNKSLKKETGLSYRKMKDGIHTFLKEKSSAGIGLILTFSIISLMTDKFLTAENLLNVARQASTNAIVAVGMTFVIITTGIDLSAGAVLALVGTVVAGMIMSYGLPIPIAIAIALLIGLLIGVGKGLIISTQKIPAFIVTLALMTVLRGMAFVYTTGRPIYVDIESFRMLGRGYIGPIPIPVILMVIVGVTGHWLLKKTSFGRHVYAVGGNEEAARLCGININKTLVGVYAYAGLMTALSGIILASRLSTGSPNAGEGAELDAIAAVVLGGTSLMGGVGSIGGTFMGVAIIGIMNNGLNLMNVSSYNQMMIKGLVILLAVWVNNLKMKKSKKNV